MNYNRIKKLLVLSLLLAVSSAGYTFAAVQKRVILGLYDSSCDSNLKDDNNPIHEYAAIILNYLGLKVRYHDLKSGLPEDPEMADVLGILNWFSCNRIPDPHIYIDWLKRCVNSGVKIVSFGHGPYIDNKTGKTVPLEKYNEYFSILGLNYHGEWTDNPLLIELVYKDSAMMEFERTLDNEISEYEKISIKGGTGGRPLLTIKRNDRNDSSSHIAVLNERGGYIMEGYELFINNTDIRAQWRVDPFRFFSEAFGLEGLPKLDYTTLFGSRIAYSHIDGDGFRNVSYIDGNSLSAGIVYEEVLRVFRFPVTASFITSEIDPAYYGSEATLALARDILFLDNVEAGSHAFTHPLDWERKITAAEVKGYSKRIEDDPEKMDIVSESHYGGFSHLSLVVADDKTYFMREIKESSDYITSKVCPEGGRTMVYQWSGNCRPPESAVGYAAEHIGRNINGGDGMFDEYNKSYTGLAPLARNIGRQTQFYTSNANENIYTHFWLKNFGGFRNVIQTFHNTEYPPFENMPPRRITPVDIYFHYYIGDREISLRALKEVFSYVMEKPGLIPLFTSEYLDTAEGFMNGSIEKISPNAWKIKGYGACRTVRFDTPGIYPDLKRSEGVLGYTVWEGHTYIHLDEKETAVLYTEKDAPSKPFLEQAASVMSSASINKNRIFFRTRVFNRSYFRFRNMEMDQSYGLRLYNSKTKKTVSMTVECDKGGILEFSIDEPGVYEVSAVLEER
ncbi:MAG: hypothetical protein ABIH89_10770 [Elusimicrobiota bacterium]